MMPADCIRILGVQLDTKLQLKRHIESVTTRATARYSAIKRLGALRPVQAKQLYSFIVTPVTDYAAEARYRQNMKSRRHLLRAPERVQRLGARMILGVFKGLALSLLEVEAGILPIELRLRQ